MLRSKAFFGWLTTWVLLSMLGAGILGRASLSVRAAPKDANALDVIINEVAWAGTSSSYPGDEWVELYNPGSAPINLAGWQLVADDGTPNVTLTGSIDAGGYYLIERSADDLSVSDIPYDDYFTGGIENNNEILRLFDDLGNEIDTANSDGGNWPAGSNSTYGTMERRTVIPDGPTAWITNNGITKNGLAADGVTPIIGTPRQTNSQAYALLDVIISEVAWMGTRASSDDEWIELYNPGSSSIDLTNWRLVADNGSPDIVLSGSISGKGFFLLERAYDNVVSDITADQIYIGELEDSNEILRLRAPDGTLVDTANSDGGAWPAGTITPKGSMERMGNIPDAPLAWVTNVNAASWTHRDASGQLVRGTPKGSNWGFNVTHTPIPPPTSTPAPTAPLTIVISEVAWAGTQSSTNDEWIELHNPSNKNINLNGWRLRSSDGSPDIQFNNITLNSGGYLLLERTDDDTTDVAADVIYTGSLSNSGEILRLYDPNGYVVDSANSNGGAWPAGISSTYSSMERSIIAIDSNFSWVTYDASKDDPDDFAHDASGNNIKGTPGRGNKPFNVTPTPTPGSGGGSSGGSSGGGTGTITLPPILGISEFLPRPGYDWNNDGIVDVFDEFIEIINAGQIDVNLSSYRLDDEQNLGSVAYPLPAVTLKPGERAVFYAAETGILLSDAGDTVRLLRGSTVVDAYTYGVVRYPDQSWCRIPDRLGYWNEPCFPTPGNPNALTGNVPLPPEGPTGYLPSVCLLPDTAPEVFVYAECEVGGDKIWNRQYWDMEDDTEPVKLEEPQKWETIFE